MVRTRINMTLRTKGGVHTFCIFILETSRATTTVCRYTGDLRKIILFIQIKRKRHTVAALTFMTTTKYYNIYLQIALGRCCVCEFVRHRWFSPPLFEIGFARATNWNLGTFGPTFRQFSALVWQTPLRVYIIRYNFFNAAYLCCVIWTCQVKTTCYPATIYLARNLMIIHRNCVE